jgi:hypothetical protein
MENLDGQYRKMFKEADEFFALYPGNTILKKNSKIDPVGIKYKIKGGKV